MPQTAWRLLVHLTVGVAVLPWASQATAQQLPPADSTRRAGKAPADSARTAPAPLPTVQVTASPVGTDVRRTAQPTAVLGGAELRRANAASLGETLQQIPGVRSLSMTTGIGKPVIRGLTNNRVVTLANGQRTETQQWGHDHSPNVESADAERIEVVKGPASVRHGSDALGGVVNVLRRALPVSDDGAALVRGRLSVAYHSASAAPSATLVGEGARGAYGWRASGTARRAGDLRTPVGRVTNTGNTTTYQEASLGRRADSVSSTLTFSARDERIDIAADPRSTPGYTGRQRIQTERGTFETTLAGAGRPQLQVQLGWEQNRRAEFGSDTTATVDLGLRSTTVNGVTNWHLPTGRGVRSVAGIALQRTDFRTFGTQTLIPDNTASSLGLYSFAQRDQGDFALSVGARHDWRSLTTPGNTVLQLAPARRHFRALTATAGAVWRAERPVSIAANVSRGFRAPSASDLFANGFHEGTRAFEIGNATLRVERALNTDLGVRVRHARGRGELTGFVNSIRDYIYLAPMGAAGRALDSLQVMQGNARLLGIEGSASVNLPRRLSLSVSGDAVHASNRSDGSALPFVPPARALATLRWEERAPGRYVALTGEWNARQTRTFRADFAPPAWIQLSLAAGRGIVTARGLVFVDLTLTNLLNTRYRDFMSRYKEFAHAAGRAAVVRVSVDL